ncbi:MULTISPECIES: efflux RND transporter periplasmic adaptor subunit [unclassified Yoonia]|uniref:efflux RND transporter periplasmic adaptor subunit n=1 Tax=unclassified Yoonia TaxID=2629118 RepID=UPI002AFE7BBF|nr:MULTISPECIES: efflux RND transporter periplasmic adaptor subunit [unclassified Yoonia]
MTRVRAISLFSLLMISAGLPPLFAQDGAEFSFIEQSAAFIAVARGVVEPSDGLMRLAAQREGLIEAVMVQEGDRVTKGQELARLNDTAAQVQLTIAQTELDQSLLQQHLSRLRADAAQAEADRLAPLRAADAMPGRQIDEAVRNAEIAAIELEVTGQNVVLAQQKLSEQRAALDAHIVRAPADGIILRRTARPGDGTSTSTVTEMFLLAPEGPLVLKAQLDEQFVGLVQVGQSAEILRERDDGSRLTGTVNRVAPVFGSLASAQPGQVAGGDAARTVEISILLEGPSDQLARLVLGQRLIARIAP